MNQKIKGITKYAVIILMSFSIGAISGYAIYEKSLEGKSLAIYSVAAKHLANNEPKKAQFWVLQAIGLRNDEPWFYELLAESSQKLHNNEDAQDYYKIAIDMYTTKGNDGKVLRLNKKLQELKQ